ncbi:hypothetical protein LXL04_006978 [Taraxacum kok-saghyz]
MARGEHHAVRKTAYDYHRKSSSDADFPPPATGERLSNDQRASLRAELCGFVVQNEELNFVGSSFIISICVTVSPIIELPSDLGQFRDGETQTRASHRTVQDPKDYLAPGISSCIKCYYGKTLIWGEMEWQDARNSGVFRLSVPYFDQRKRITIADLTYPQPVIMILKFIRDLDADIEDYTLKVRQIRLWNFTAWENKQDIRGLGMILLDEQIADEKATQRMNEGNGQLSVSESSICMRDETGNKKSGSMYDQLSNEKETNFGAKTCMSESFFLYMHTKENTLIEAHVKWKLSNFHVSNSSVKLSRKGNPDVIMSRQA